MAPVPRPPQPITPTFMRPDPLCTPVRGRKDVNAALAAEAPRATVPAAKAVVLTKSRRETEEGDGADEWDADG